MYFFGNPLIYGPVPDGVSCIYAFSKDHKKHVFNWEYDDNTAKNTSKLLYNAKVTTNGENNNNLTYLSRDGILFTHGSNLFGFGYDYISADKPEPCIIYYNKENDTSIVQTKPISDLFK